MNKIARNFDSAAPHYDRAASVQAQIAERLVEWADPPAMPLDALDAGCGTGFVASAILKCWPNATITALDHAPEMLRAARQKIPGLRIIEGDAARIDLAHRFDAIFSGMALHWLPEPLEALRRWQNWLKPGGRIYAALLVEGSFHEWRGICEAVGLQDGLWDMPRADFADDFATHVKREKIAMTYSSALEFLQRLKAAGAATPREGHEPFSAAVMRRLLAKAPRPFIASYDVLYIALPSSPNI